MSGNTTPVLNMHGDNDNVVPYNSAILYMSGIFPIMEVDGSSAIADFADNEGINNCYKQFNGAGHTPHVASNEYLDTTLTYMTSFLAQFTCGDAFTCADNALFTSISELKDAKKGFTTYPNPATDFLTIETNLENGAQISVFDVLGNKVYDSVLSNSITVLKTQNLQPGYYFVRLTDNSGAITQKVVIE